MRVFLIFGRFLAFVLPIVASVAVLVNVASLADGPRRRDAQETTVQVRVLPAAALRIVPRAVGYGSVVPATSWSAIPEVSGRVIERSPSLERGIIVEEGALLFKIDPSDFYTKLARAEAALEIAHVDLERLEQEITNTRYSIRISTNIFSILERDFKRKTLLSKKNRISQTSVDQAESDVGKQRQVLQNLRNTLAILEIKQKSGNAKIAQSLAEVTLAKSDVDRTEIRAPFTGSVAFEEVAVGQYLLAGHKVATLDGIAEVEISVHFTADRLLPLIDADKIPVMKQPSASEMARVLANVNVHAKVRFTSGNVTFVWPGRFRRIEDSLHPVSRTAGVVVAVAGPYQDLRPGKQPPLIKNMFVEVELIGEERQPAIVIPRYALHGNKVFVVDSENRLRMRHIEIGLWQPQFVTVSKGLAEGELVVISDPQPAVEGMLLGVSVDKQAANRLAAIARGQERVR